MPPKGQRRRNERRGGAKADQARGKGGRGPSTLPWLFGHHAVSAALANPDRQLERLLATPQGIELLQADFGPKLPISPESVDRRDLEALLPPGAVHQGIALLAQPLEQPDFEDLLDLAGDTDGEDDEEWEGSEDGAAPRPPLLIALDQATDPRNVGAVMRSAAAFGALGVIVPERHAADATGVLAKAASGALEKVALVRVTNLVRAMEQAKKAGFWCIGLDGRGTEDLPEADLSGPVLLILGAEGSGLRRLTAETCDRLLRIPMTDAVESLNLAAAASIVLYQASLKR
ncbi:MAG: 23S rRNA (guanosine(2251)-2'-O)-methyltransferase RlmB [Rhodospirillales bacterium]